MDDEMMKQLSCSVCLDLYKDPLLLPCLHSLCRQCVQSLTTAGIKECPECKADFGQGVNRPVLKRNFPLNNLVEIYKQYKQASPPLIQTRQTTHAYQNIAAIQQTTQPRQQTASASSRPSLHRQCSTCDLGSASDAEVYCETCTMSFCAECLDSLHPKNTDHVFISVVNKIQTCVLCESAASVRCLECQMTFCQQCLRSYHPTIISSPGHTLAEMKAPGTSHQIASTTSSGTLPPPRQQYNSGIRALPQIQARSFTWGAYKPSIGGSRVFSSLEIARDVSNATQDRSCSLCRVGKEASHRCLDCSISICQQCLYYHKQDAPSHTVINISVARQQGQREQQDRQIQQDQPVQQAQKLEQRRTPSTSPHDNDIQQKLVELMEIKADVLVELMEALRRRDTSEA